MVTANAKNIDADSETPFPEIRPCGAWPHLGEWLQEGS